jgi:hypothetical protein
MSPVVPTHRLIEEMRIEVFQDVMQCCWVSGSQEFKGLCCLHLQAREVFFDCLMLKEGTTIL